MHIRKTAAMVVFAVLAGSCWAQEGAGAGRGQEQGTPGISMRHSRMYGMAFNEELFPPEMIMQNQKAIGLSDDQKNSILEVMKEFSAKFTELQWKQSGEQEAMSDLLKQDRIDEAKTLEQLDKLLAAENEIKKLNLGNLIKIRNLLTPEQKEKMKGIRQSMMSKMSEEFRDRHGGQNRQQPPPRPPEE